MPITIRKRKRTEEESDDEDITHITFSPAVAVDSRTDVARGVDREGRVDGLSKEERRRRKKEEEMMDTVGCLKGKYRGGRGE